MNLLYFLPKNALSRLVGRLVHFELPQPFARLMVSVFAACYRINIQEAEKSLWEYKSIGELFTRKLKEGVRPLGSAVVLHPADSVVAQAGGIKSGAIIQAKGKSYTPSELTGDPKDDQFFEGGAFVTYYLCPTDYHRVHASVSGRLTRAVHIPGDLWPVNQWSVENINKVFCVNERLIVDQETEFGKVKTVFVGATNVGQISLTLDAKVSSNIEGVVSGAREFNYTPGLDVKKGDELGIFHMGSTVVMLFPPTAAPYLLDIEKLISRPVKVRADFQERG